MSQNDLSIANQGFASFRSDLNSALQALGSTNSGTSAPSTTYANQLFYDTTNNILKIRNEDNDAFINLITLDQTNDKAKFDLDGTELILDADGDTSIEASTDDTIVFDTAGSERVRITSTGDVGIGDASPESNTNFTALTVSSTASTGGGQIYVQSSSVSSVFGADNTSDPKSIVQTVSNHPIVFGTNNAERMRLATSANFGIGTSTPTDTAGFGICLDVSSSTGGAVYMRDSAGSKVGHIGQFNEQLSLTSRQDDGIISFFTGASPTEHVRLQADGKLLLGTTSDAGATQNTDLCCVFSPSGRLFTTADGHHDFNRQSDGEIIRFRSATGVEGQISVSGSTVSYGGFSGLHESSGIATNTPIGTVVSTIDELDVYPDKQDGEDHPKAGKIRADHAKVKVSDTTGDSSVYGVVNNFTTEGKVNIASVGIGSVRVTGACTKGDLLESNGDGTAKVQSDDILRSKTIGKVTIGNSNTGVKLVSCVLYCG